MKFLGYMRPDGKVGVRNHVLVMPTCYCASVTAERIASCVEGAVSFHNQLGCSQALDDVQYTIDVLVGFAANPNVYGTVLIGNGCEVCGIAKIAALIKERTNKPLFMMNIQDTGGTPGTIQEGMRCAQALVEEASMLKPVACDFSHLIMGTECGGSDATSGISANPIIGKVSDRVVAEGGTAILSETTEFMGAEHILASRAKDEEVARKVLKIVSDYEQHLINANTNVRGANPAPGNKEGGITTLAEKSLGCIHKGGSTPIQEVYAYAQQVAQKGLVIMDTPGADAASVCGMVAGGAQVVIFSSGRGTPIGNPIAPVIKITGNPTTFAKMGVNIDYEASGGVTGNETIAEQGQKLFDLMCDVVNGKKTKAEIFGNNEIGIPRLCNYV
nr:UxaA family hydrolase [uncultured Sphaerochaeta sp.]